MLLNIYTFPCDFQNYLCMVSHLVNKYFERYKNFLYSNSYFKFWLYMFSLTVNIKKITEKLNINTIINILIRWKKKITQFKK